MSSAKEQTVAQSDERLIRTPTLAEIASINKGKAEFDFINRYADYADVLEAPRIIHEAVATTLLSAVLNGRVYINLGAINATLDLWMLLLSDSGFGRSTLAQLALPVLRTAKTRLDARAGSKDH